MGCVTNLRYKKYIGKSKNKRKIKKIELTIESVLQPSLWKYLRGSTMRFLLRTNLLKFTTLPIKVSQLLSKSHFGEPQLVYMFSA